MKKSELRKIIKEEIQKRNFKQIVKSLDSVIDNIEEVNPTKNEIKVLNGMINALNKKLSKIN